MLNRLAPALVLPLAVAACSGAGAPAPPDASEPSVDLAPANKLVEARPYGYDVPASYDGSKPTPLVILLHGYSANGFIQRGYWGMAAAIEKHGFLFAWPDGTKDARGNLFWNATNACCDFGMTGVDDVAYVDAIIDDMSAHFNVDKKRIYVTGHSNGGYMSHRYACDRASRIAGFAALAGSVWKDESKCPAAEPVAALQIHGDMDDAVEYLGNAAIPSARDSVATWAKKNGCAAMPTDTSGAPLDLEKNLPGAETTVERWTGCKPGGAAELWTIKGGGHVPIFDLANWTDGIFGWFKAHPKP